VSLSRELERQARRLSDQQSDRIRATSPTGNFYATVSSVSAGGSQDGNALVAVRWRGAEVTVAGYAASYTPVVGHRVVCALIDNQVEIMHRSIGHP
jgi:hypothetical protein